MLWRRHLRVLGLSDVHMRKLLFIRHFARYAVSGLRVLDGLFVGPAEKYVAIANRAVTDTIGRCRAEFRPDFRALEAER